MDEYTPARTDEFLAELRDAVAATRAGVAAGAAGAPPAAVRTWEELTEALEARSLSAVAVLAPDGRSSVLVQVQDRSGPLQVPAGGVLAARDKSWILASSPQGARLMVLG